MEVKHYTCTRLFKHTFKHLLTAGVRILEKTVSVVFERNKSSMFLTFHGFIVWKIGKLPYFSIDNARVIYTKKV